MFHGLLGEMFARSEISLTPIVSFGGLWNSKINYEYKGIIVCSNRRDCVKLLVKREIEV